MKIDLSGIETDINQETAQRAFYNTSHSPELRGDRVTEDYQAALKSLAEYIEGYARDDRQKAIAQKVFDGLRATYRAKTQKWLSAQSRCISAMIVGPARFPVRRAEKANMCEHKRAEEWLSFSNLMCKYAGKALDSVFTTEEKRDSALESLKAQLSYLEGLQDFMKQANALHRKKDLAGLEALFKGRYGENGAARMAEYLKPDYAGRIGFEGWRLSNNLANIKRIRERVIDLEDRVQKAETVPQESEKLNGLEVIRNHEEDRLQLIFGGKPNESVRGVLKSNGFKWSPRFGAWQRQLTPNAELALKRILTEVTA